MLYGSIRDNVQTQTILSGAQVLKYNHKLCSGSFYELGEEIIVEPQTSRGSH